MPHCADCDKYWTPNSMTADGACPTCGRRIAEVRAAGDGDDVDDEDDYRAPWHFKLIVALTVIYLAWRFLQLFDLLPS